MGKELTDICAPLSHTTTYQNKRQRSPPRKMESCHSSGDMCSQRLPTTRCSRLQSHQHKDTLRKYLLSLDRSGPKCRTAKKGTLPATKGSESAQKREGNALRASIGLLDTTNEGAINSKSSSENRTASFKTWDDPPRNSHIHESQKAVTSVCSPVSPVSSAPTTHQQANATNPASISATAVDHQLNLTYRGYPLQYRLSSLPDDPSVPLALLAVTQSDPGTYLVISAHYRRTGRPRAARSVLQALLRAIDGASEANKENGALHARPVTTGHSFVSPDIKRSAYRSSVTRPAFLMLAACELDISRENTMDPESDVHTSAAHELFRTVYGTSDDSIIRSAHEMGCGRSNRSATGTTTRSSGSDLVLSERIRVLEKELKEAHDSRKQLMDDCIAAQGTLDSVKVEFRLLESRYQEALHLLGIDENKR